VVVIVRLMYRIVTYVPLSGFGIVGLFIKTTTLHLLALYCYALAAAKFIDSKYIWIAI